VRHYEERYRATGRAVGGLAAVALAVGIGYLWHLPVIFLPVGAALLAITAQGAGVIDRARRTTAFRADQAGVTLGAVPDKLTVRRGSVLFIPWPDVQGIVFYRVRPRGRGSRAPVQCVGIQRRPGAPPLRWGNEQAPGCPVPGVPAWATRTVTGWRLDRDRLAAVTAAAAPGVSLIDAGTGPGPAAGEPGRGSAVGELRRAPSPPGEPAAELARGAHAVIDHGGIDVQATDLVRVLRAPVPHVLDAQHREALLRGDPLPQFLVPPGHVQVRVVRASAWSADCRASNSSSGAGGITAAVQHTRPRDDHRDFPERPGRLLLASAG